MFAYPFQRNASFHIITIRIDMVSRRRLVFAGLVLLFLFALGGLSCDQYDYNSPLPGVVEVRLAVKNNRTGILNFTPPDTTGATAASFFVLNVKTLEIFQSSTGARLPIYANVYAIRRNPDGDDFNALAMAARDSQIVLGAGNAAPGTYDRLELTVAPASFLVRSFGAYTTQIDVVDQPPYQQLQQMPPIGVPLSITVQEGHTTRVVVTFDMDSSLIRRVESFNHLPHYFVSSVNVY
jgi:hypothetical protein